MSWLQVRDCECCQAKELQVLQCAGAERNAVFTDHSRMVGIYKGGNVCFLLHVMLLGNLCPIIELNINAVNDI